jgi:dUTPase
MDSQPTTISRTREAGRDFCAAAGNSDAMLAFMSRHGIPSGVKHELDDDHHVQIYLRVRNSTEKQLQLFGPALDPDLADNVADIIVREHNERVPKVAEAV